MVGVDRQRGIQCDCGQLSPKQRLFAVVAQLGRDAGRAAQTQEWHFLHPCQQGIERAEMRQQYGGGLRAHSRYAGNVVDRVAREGQVVSDLMRVDAMPPLHAARAPTLVAGVVPLLVVFVEQLRQVLVGGHDHATEAVRALPHQRRPDQVIGFVLLMCQHGEAEGEAQCLAMRELALEFVRRGVAVGLVGRIQRVAEAGIQCFVEGDGDVLRANAVEQFQQKAGEAVHGIGGPAVRVGELVRHRMPGTEHVHAGVDQK